MQRYMKCCKLALLCISQECNQREFRASVASSRGDTRLRSFCIKTLLIINPQSNNQSLQQPSDPICFAVSLSLPPYRRRRLHALSSPRRLHASPDLALSSSRRLHAGMSRAPSRDNSTRGRGNHGEGGIHGYCVLRTGGGFPLLKTLAHHPDLGAHRTNLSSTTVDLKPMARAASSSEQAGKEDIFAAYIGGIGEQRSGAAAAPGGGHREKVLTIFALTLVE